MAILPEVGAACERYAERAEPVGVLAAFGRAHNAPMPDFIATESALRQLIVDGAEGGFVGADALDSLELAAGALAEAHREATSGNKASASSSTQVAALNLSELRSSPLTGCFP